MPRPTKWTQKVQNAIVALIEAGDRPEVAAGVNGIPRSSFFEWMAAGRAGVEPYAGFRTAVERARDSAESQLRATALAGDDQGVGFGPAKAALEVLSRRWPRQWAQRIKHEIEDAERLMLGALERVCADPHVLERVRQEQSLRCVLVSVCEELAREDGEGEAAGDPGAGASPVH